MSSAEVSPRSTALDDTGIRRDKRYSLRWIYLHMIEAYARHIGHADLIRELVDGEVGLKPEAWRAWPTPVPSSAPARRAGRTGQSATAPHRGQYRGAEPRCPWGRAIFAASTSVKAHRTRVVVISVI